MVSVNFLFMSYYEYVLQQYELFFSNGKLFHFLTSKLHPSFVLQTRNFVWVFFFVDFDGKSECNRTSSIPFLSIEDNWPQVPIYTFHITIDQIFLINDIMYYRVIIVTYNHEYVDYI